MEQREPEAPPAEPDGGGEAACALHRVCEACGALEDGPPGAVCRRCGAPREVDGRTET